MHDITPSHAPRRRYELLVLAVLVALVAAFAIALASSDSGLAAGTSGTPAGHGVPIQDTQATPQAVPDGPRRGDCPHHDGSGQGSGSGSGSGSGTSTAPGAASGPEV